MANEISELPFGFINNQPVIQYTITNRNHMQVSILNYGATISEIITFDRNKKPGDVVLGFKSLEGFLQENNPYFGSVIGRFANRIAMGKFSMGDQTYSLATNNNGNSLHGGRIGFDKVIWQTKKIGRSDLTLSYLSVDGEEGYPGDLEVSVNYSLTDDNELRISYTAETDKATPVNLTNHSYFNLSAGEDLTICDHVLTINAARVLEVDEQLIPTGRLLDVAGTAMDFTSDKLIGQDLDQVAGGYDHNWVLNVNKDANFPAASVFHPASGRFMEMFTTEPGIQFYSGNFLDGTLTGTKSERAYPKHAGLCLEAQHFPDSPNQPSFPNTILRPGDVYRQRTVYKFGIK